MKLFKEHPRSWRDNTYVYPVISRRSRGLSVGVNLNIDKACNFDCVYCSVDRSGGASARPAVRGVDLAALEAELDGLLSLALDGRLFEQPPFDQTPPAFRRLNDVAFSGDGEPTACTRLMEACRLVHTLLSRHGAAESARIVLITNATLLQRPAVREATDFLAEHNGQIWAKLDAGTAKYYQRVARSKVPLETVLANITDLARRQAVVIQSLFLRLGGEGPGKEEIEAYINRLRAIRDAGGRLEHVQVYTVARAVANAGVSALDDLTLDSIVARLRAAGFLADAFHAPHA